jgi:hypothetical protein
MQSVHLKVHGRIEPDGRLRLDVRTQLPPGEADVALTIESNETSGNHRYDFSDLAGRLIWHGDAVAEQRGIRDEW